MTRALRHAIFSAVLNPEAMATFLFLPSWGGPMTIDHYSKLLAAYPHICCKLGTFSSTDHYDTSQSWANKEIPLPQHTWNMHIIAVWNACAIRHLNTLNPTWIHDLAKNIPEAHWHFSNINNDPIIKDRDSGTEPGFCKFTKLPTDKKTSYQTSSQPNHRGGGSASQPVKSPPYAQNSKLEVMGLH